MVVDTSHVRVCNTVEEVWTMAEAEGRAIRDQNRMFRKSKKGFR